MSRIHEDLPYKDFQAPDTVEKTTVCARTLKLPNYSCPTVTEYIDVANLPTERCNGDHSNSYQHPQDNDSGYSDYQSDYDSDYDSSEDSSYNDYDSSESSYNNYEDSYSNDSEDSENTDNKSDSSYDSGEDKENNSGYSDEDNGEDDTGW